MSASSATEAQDALRSTLRSCVAGIAIAACIGMFVNVLYLIQPFYMLQIYDRVINGRSIDTLIMLSILAGGIVLFLGMLDFLRGRIFLIVGEQMARRLGGMVLQAAVQDSLRAQSLESSQAMRDLQEVRQFLTGGPVTLPFDGLMTPLFLVVLFCLHPAYGVLALIGIALLVGLGLVMEFVARRPSMLANDAAMKSHAEVATAIRHAELIEAMGMLPALTRRWQQGQRRALFLLGAGNTASKAISTIARGVRMVLQMGMLATGAVLVIDQDVTAGTMLAASLMMGRVLYPFEQIIEGWRQWGNALGALRRLRSVLAGRNAGRGAMPLAVGDPRLTADRLTFIPHGSDRPVLRGLNFAIEPGEVIGIIGPSGAGKSTLARLMVGIWRPTAGGLFLDGHDVYAWDRASFGRQIGYLPQHPALLNGTVRTNISRLEDGELGEVIRAAKQAGVHELIGRLPLGYETRVGEGGFELSGGQRQRIALARALFGSPRLLVLDEPNSNMDGEGEQHLIRAIGEAKATGATVVIVAQRMSILSVADRLLVLRDGAVERFAGRAEVLQAIARQGASAAPSDGKITALPIAARG
ncbi:MAG: type I secretion system permease/ATPase [Rhodospirillales bacterium]